MSRRGGSADVYGSDLKSDFLAIANGTADGQGDWWIMKKRITGGGAVRFSKPGYYPVEMSESEFLQGSNFLMQPKGSDSQIFDPWS